MKNILIIGAGWLGKPLALQLSKLGHNVCITGRDQEKLQLTTQQLNQQLSQINPQLSVQNETLNLVDEQSQQQLQNILIKYSIDTIIGCFPPGFRQGIGQAYAHYWQKIALAAQEFSSSNNNEHVSQITKILMISATSVYPEIAELMTEDKASLALVETLTSIDNLTSTEPLVHKENPIKISAQRQSQNSSSNKAQIILKAEQHLIDSKIPYAILRLSGLFGPERHPARFIPHIKKISNKAPANMLHQQDAIHASIFALNNIENMIVNVTTPHQLSKADFYQAALDQVSTVDRSKTEKQMVLPNISQDSGKQVCPEKLIKLGYQFKFKSFFDALESKNYH